MTADLMAAVNVWHSHWARLKDDAIQQHVWEGYGFWRNGDQYEAAIRLLLSERAKPHLRSLLGGQVRRLDLLKRLVG